MQSNKQKLIRRTFSGIETYQIPGHFDAGSVIVRVKTNEQVINKKVIIQNKINKS